MSLDLSFLKLSYRSIDSSEVMQEYIEYIANKELLRYKSIIHTGGKAGESLWSHIMNLVTIIEKLRSVFALTADEMRCLLLALTIHDINKLSPYGKLPGGKGRSYANAATLENLKKELTELEVSSFFPEWERYLYDIKYLVDAHQEKSVQASQYDQRLLDQCELDDARLEGPLKYLMKVADVADNSHSGDYWHPHEKHIRDKLLAHLNAALNAAGDSRRYRFVGHRLSELRGIQTNIIHNVIVTYMQTTSGKDVCIDLLYHPEGVDYLLDTTIPFAHSRQQIAERIAERFATLQSDQLAQFIKARRISVDDAAMQSGASLQDIFICILHIVERKQYRLEWRQRREAFLRNDLEAFLVDSAGDALLKERVRSLLSEPILMPPDDEQLKRGELLMAYRKFLKDHRSDQLSAIKQDAWRRVARLYGLSTEADALYDLIDPYRRAYFMARDLPERSLADMLADALADLAHLNDQAMQAQGKRKGKKMEQEEITEQEGEVIRSFDTAYILDYLERTLEVWESRAPVAEKEQAGQAVNFADSLRRYVDQKRPHSQCCYCGSPLKASEWMAAQVPPSIGVQSFSNRLAGGSSREPKRNVCDICRTQFILEKLAWPSHRDRQGGDLVTFYLHFFPYSFYTQPMLQAWWQSIQSLSDSGHRSIFLDTGEYFSGRQEQGASAPQKVIRCYYKGIEGMSIPALAESMSNTPVLPLILGGSNYGKKFLLALEKALMLALWFDSRVLLSRLPTPLLNLANEYRGEDPIALLVEGVPQGMDWLLPTPLLTRQELQQLYEKLSRLHQIASTLTTTSEDFTNALYDLVIAAAQDPLALYYEADRLIERRATQNKSRPESYTITLSQKVAPLLTQLLEGEKV
ncbi:MAG: type I-D CRISPR-associated protein Cas10d/Csc3 [Ktedonobacteraceae bacterium]|nr:type I-D CRISPR-associated protein Cas10d/Csc3 [Ktedonobacteraceae bacterium]